MGGATIWPVPRAIDAEAHYYPRRWKRNMLFLYGGMFLIGIQVQRYAQLCRVSTCHFYHTNERNSHCLVFIAIDDSHRRIHGLGQQRRPQAHQVRQLNEPQDYHPQKHPWLKHTLSQLNASSVLRRIFNTKN